MQTEFSFNYKPSILIKFRSPGAQSVHFDAKRRYQTKIKSRDETMTAEPFPRELDSIDDREISAALVGQSPNTSERTPSLHFNPEMTIQLLIYKRLR